MSRAVEHLTRVLAKTARTPADELVEAVIDVVDERIFRAQQLREQAAAVGVAAEEAMDKRAPDPVLMPSPEAIIVVIMAAFVSENDAGHIQVGLARKIAHRAAMTLTGKHPSGVLTDAIRAEVEDISKRNRSARERGE